MVDFAGDPVFQSGHNNIGPPDCDTPAVADVNYYSQLIERTDKIADLKFTLSFRPIERSLQAQFLLLFRGYASIACPWGYSSVHEPRGPS